MSVNSAWSDCEDIVFQSKSRRRTGLPMVAGKKVEKGLDVGS